MKLTILLLSQTIIAKRFIIQFNEEVGVNSTPSPIHIQSTIHKNTVVVDCEDSDLGDLKNVKYIEEDFEVNADVEQSNPIWNLAKLSNSSKYTYPDLISDTNVYIVDTGIDITHPEFQGRATWGNNFVDSCC